MTGRVFAILLGLLAWAALLPTAPGAAPRLRPGLVARSGHWKSTDNPADIAPAAWSRTWIDKTIDFDSATEAPPGAAVRQYFYIRWTGILRVPRTNSYTFAFAADDGVRFFLDGQKIIETWRFQALHAVTNEVWLEAGDHEVQVDYFQRDGPCICQWSWASAGFPMGPVPESVLFHPPADPEPKTRWWPVSVSPNDRVGQYTSRLWQEDDGLPDNRVLSLAQTPEGYLWVGTRQGLARFDGVTFTRAGLPLTPLLGARPVTALCAAADGSLWVGTEGGGALRWRHGQATRFNTTNGLASPVVRALHETQEGALWIATDAGLSRYADGRMTVFADPGGLASSAISALDQDRHGTVWAATAAGLGQVHKGGISTSWNRGKPLAPTRLFALCGDRQGELWVGTDQGLAALRHGQFVERIYTRQDGLADDRVSAIHEDRRGNLWVGTAGGLNRLTGVTYFDANSPLNRGGFLTEQRADGGFFDHVHCLFEDREGNIWIGSDEGLSRLQLRSITTYGRAEGLAAHNVMALLEDPDENLWMATAGGGLNQLKGGKIVAHTARRTPGHLTTDRLLALACDRRGNLWIGGDDQAGLFHFHEDTFERLEPRNGLPAAAIRVVHEDRQGRLWVGTSHGLSCRQGGQWTLRTTADGLAGNSVRVIFEDRATNLWVGTDEGLSLWRDGALVSFRTNQGLPHPAVLALHEDDQGALWIGTGGGGLCRVHADGSGRSLSARLAPPGAGAGPLLPARSYAAPEGLPCAEIFAILEDDYGCLWISGRNGIFRVRKQGLEDFDLGRSPAVACTVFGREDGLTSGQCNGQGKPSAWKGRDGRLWFATTQGAAVADPHLRVDHSAPPVLIEEFVADQRRILPSPAAAPTAGAGAPPPPPRFLVPPGRGELEIHYTALSLQQPEKCRFQYRLEGVDPGWVDAGTRRAAFYNNLDPGRYRFRVIAGNKHGVWNETGATADLILQPHFWQTWWFLALACLAAASSIAGLARHLATRKLRRKLLALERAHDIEQERARIARDMHDQLGASLTRISLLGEIAGQDAGKPPETRAHAARICATAHEVAQTLDEIVWAVNPRNDTLDHLVSYLALHAEEFFDPTPIRCRLDLPPDLPALPLSAEVRHNLFLAFKEALNNIAKHARATEVWVRVSRQDATLRIAIEDNGCGLPSGTPPATGNGLGNMARRLHDIGGRCDLSRPPQGGTCVSLEIPLAME